MLLELVERGLSVQRGAEFGLSYQATQYWLERYELKTEPHHYSRDARRPRRRSASARSRSDDVARSGERRVLPLPQSRWSGSQRTVGTWTQTLVAERRVLRLRPVRRRTHFHHVDPVTERFAVGARELSEASVTCVKRRGKCRTTQLPRGGRGGAVLVRVSRDSGTRVLNGRSIRLLTEGLWVRIHPRSFQRPPQAGGLRRSTARPLPSPPWRQARARPGGQVVQSAAGASEPPHGGSSGSKPASGSAPSRSWRTSCRRQPPDDARGAAAAVGRAPDPRRPRPLRRVLQSEGMSRTCGVDLADAGGADDLDARAARRAPLARGPIAGRAAVNADDAVVAYLEAAIEDAAGRAGHGAVRHRRQPASTRRSRGVGQRPAARADRLDLEVLPPTR